MLFFIFEQVRLQSFGRGLLVRQCLSGLLRWWHIVYSPNILMNERRKTSRHVQRSFCPNLQLVFCPVCPFGPHVDLFRLPGYKVAHAGHMLNLDFMYISNLHTYCTDRAFILYWYWACFTYKYIRNANIVEMCMFQTFHLSLKII